MSSSATEATRLTDVMPPWLSQAFGSLLYGVRLATAVALALFIAFTLQLDNPSWAGTSAAIVCQPILGSSLRKGFFRAIGTVVGATMAVVLTGIFPQNRVGFLVGMAAWAAVCSFGGTLTRNFAAYAFALSGYTLAIIAGDSISAPNQVFALAVTRASEILIGIACASLVMSLTDLGRAHGRLDAALDGLGGEIASHFAALLGAGDDRSPEGPALRRALVRRVAQLDPLIDQAIGESPELRQRGAILRAAMAGLFVALSGWRIAESHLGQLPPETARREALVISGRLPASWRSASTAGPPVDALSDLAAGRCEDLAAVRDLSGLAATDVSGRLLADAAADMALGLAAAANGVALLRNPAAACDPGRIPGFVVTDTLPAFVNALRVFLTVGVMILLWIVTEWPNGLGAVTFAAVTVLLLSPQSERSGPAAVGFGIGTVAAACLAAVTNFALLPNREGFLSLALVMGAVLVPVAALSTVPALAPYVIAACLNFVPLLGPTNVISFDTASFYNAALAIVAGCLVGAAALVVIPPIPARTRAARLVALTMRDLQRMASGRRTPSPAAWQTLVYARLVAMPEGVEGSFPSDLVAILTLGLQVLRLQGTSGQGSADIAAGLRAVARSDLHGMGVDLDRADATLARTAADPRSGDIAALRIRTAIQIIRDVVRQHPGTFEGATI